MAVIPVTLRDHGCKLYAYERKESLPEVPRTTCCLRMAFFVPSMIVFFSFCHFPRGLWRIVAWRAPSAIDAAAAAAVNRRCRTDGVQFLQRDMTLTGQASFCRAGFFCDCLEICILPQPRHQALTHGFPSSTFVTEKCFTVRENRVLPLLDRFFIYISRCVHLLLFSGCGRCCLETGSYLFVFPLDSNYLPMPSENCGSSHYFMPAYRAAWAAANVRGILFCCIFG